MNKYKQCIRYFFLDMAALTILGAMGGVALYPAVMFISCIIAFAVISIGKNVTIKALSLAVILFSNILYIVF